MNSGYKARMFGAAFAGLLALTTSTSAQVAGDALQQGFNNPPDSAKPRVWWHWTGGNVTKDGITKDLEWMKRVGIGGRRLLTSAKGVGRLSKIRSPSSRPLGSTPSSTPRQRLTVLVLR